MRLTKKQAGKLKLLSTVRTPKYRNKKVEYCGFVFDSKFECQCYQYLECLKAAGKVTRILRQVPFLLAPKSKLIVDFEVKFANENDVRYLDAKGFMTDNSLTKIKIAEYIYGVKIEIIRKGDFQWSREINLLNPV